ncbi:mechanosensitive ion channel protein MscS [Algimonas arctica]|uniref:Small-conductance mechanosensitive channel n=1 Tax=Algimonas arctica TaxID=1479486 RepID=A0A8J3G1K9_9PROT|nr:mechanosensitive ion channel family protein [Algimonas arctica]GHA86749.1 mechanosensitive ion channel protein MscS [Algimonas arctica]
MRHFIILLFVSLCWPLSAFAQDAPITVAGTPSDAQITARLSGIYQQLTDTHAVTVAVNNSVVTLSGHVANTEVAERAIAIASRTDGVVAVQDDINRTLGVSDNVSPLLAEFRDQTLEFIRALPLIGAALISLIAIILFGRWLSRRNALIKRFAKNPFMVELIANAVNLAFIIIALIVALNILGATALIGTVLGGAGIIGIALGFGIRDTVENYVASLLLSIRQPFRAKDHVIIDKQEGIVVRLNTRATILMTLDGNHLRIPNAKVFKADILNYSTNPTRRFSFGVGVDSADDPVAAIRLGISVMAKLDFILSDPAPKGIIREVGDSSILIDFYGWVDQRETDFGSARSQAIRDVKDALEADGFSLPEPIYRLKVDGAMPTGPTPSQSKEPKKDEPKSENMHTQADMTITDKVAKERKSPDGQTDLLDDSAPPE